MSGPFRRVLVANRGEIALRIIRACHEMGMEAVAVYSDADAGARHVREADASVRLGPGPAAESYLRGELLVRAALDSGAQAVHPGYGFLSERATFAAAVRDAGLVFVGPTPEVIAAIGDKLAARRLARQAGVPHVPGTLEPAPTNAASDVDKVIDAAKGVGYPLLVKAAAGEGVAACAAWPVPTNLPPRWRQDPARPRLHSATASSTWNARSAPHATSRCSSSATPPAAWLPSANATARSSDDTRS